MFKKLLSLAALALCAGSMNAQIESGSQYYIQNVESGLYLCGQNNWGTRSTVATQGDLFTANLNDGKYELVDNDLSSGNKALGTNLFTDSTGANWTIEAVEGEDGVYTIKNDAGYIAQSATAGYHIGYLTEQVANVTDAAKWYFLTVDAAKAKLAEATKDAPIDATFLIGDANFSRNHNAGSWTMDASNKNLCGGNLTGDNNSGAQSNGCAESWRSAFTLSQTLTVPNGVYELTAQASVCEYTSEGTNLPVVYANDATSTFNVSTSNSTMSDGENSMTAMSAAFANGKYVTEPAKVTVSDGKLTIGVKGTRTNTWCIWDNFQLKYYGVDLSELQTAFETARNTAYSLLSANMNKDVKSELQRVYDLYKDATPSTEADLNSAITALNNAINPAKSSKEVYEKIAAIPVNDLTDSGKAACEVTTKYNNGTYTTLAEAEAEYRTAVLAQTEDGANFTGAIINPNFDGNINGWTDGFTSATAVNHNYQGATYSNGDVSVSGFMEAWTWGSNLGDGKLSQVINGLPEGNYTLSADLIAVAQDTRIAEGTAQVGVYVFATCKAGTFKSVDCSTGNGLPEKFSFTFDTTAGDCELGLMTQSTNCNWIAFDNVKLVRNGASTVNVYQKALKDAVDAATDPESITVECDAALKKDYADKLSTAKTISETNGKTDKEYQDAREDLDNAKAKLEASIKAYAYSKPIRDAVSNGTNVAIYADSAEDMAANWSLDHEDVNFHFNHWSTEGESDGTGMGKNFNEYWTAGGGKLADGVITRTRYEGLTQGNYAVSMLVRVENEAGGEATGVKFNDIEINSTNATKFGKGVYAVVTDVITVGADGELKFGFTVKDAEANWFVWKGLTIKYLGTATTDATATVKAAAKKYGTFCAPYVVAAPEGAKVYTVTDVDAENNIVMTEVEGAIPANTPVLIENTTESAINVETSGVDYATIRDLNKGLLTGVLEEKTAPAGSYVLQTWNDAQAFFKVEEGKEPTIAANKAYLYVYSDAGTSEIKAFGLGAENGQETAIKALDALTSGTAKIYDLNGRQLKSLQKGMNIVNGVKVMVK